MAKKLRRSRPDRKSTAALKTRRGRKSSTLGSSSLRSASRRATQAAVKRIVESQELPVNRTDNTSEERAYRKALDFLLSQTDYERMRVVRYNTTTFNLDRMRLLLKHLGDPHTKFKSVHVAGTKGKGSTCHMLAAMLRACGLKVGLYTSPHLVDMRERITINGSMISPADMTHWVKRIEHAIAKMGADKPTFFEIITAIGFCHFAQQEVDIAVVEVGLGGRLDSTNVITPEVAAVTSISYDHTAILGNTLEKIGEEKAGIFKKDIPALTVIQPPSVVAAMRRVAERNGTRLEVVGEDIEFSYRFEIARPLGPHIRATLHSPISRFEQLVVPLVGEHQAINFGLALAVLDKLKQRGFKIEEARALEGVKDLSIEGRMELIWRDPRVILDGAHNAASMQALFRGISQYIPYDSMVVIFGCNCDKDIDGMLEQVSHGADKVIFTQTGNNPKAASPEELAAHFTERFGRMAQVAPDFKSAMAIATRAITREDLITVTGSFYLVGEAKVHFASRADRMGE